MSLSNNPGVSITGFIQKFSGNREKESNCENIKYFYLDGFFYENKSLQEVLKGTKHDDSFYTSLAELNCKYAADVIDKSDCRYQLGKDDFKGIFLKGLNKEFQENIFISSFEKRIAKLLQKKADVDTPSFNDYVTSLSNEEFFILNNIAYFNTTAAGLFNICEQALKDKSQNFDNFNYVEYSQSVYNSEKMQALLKEYVTKLCIYFANKSFSKEDFYKLFPANLLICPGFKDYVLDSFIKDNIIEIINDESVLFKPAKISEIYSLIPECKEKEIITHLLEGCSLDETGEKMGGVTRELIRQKLNKLKHYLKADEEKYYYIYQNYKFSDIPVTSIEDEKNNFCNIFNEHESSFFYLKRILGAQGDSNKKPFIEEALNDDNVSIELKKKIFKFNSNRYVEVDGIPVLKKKWSIIDFVIKHYCKETVRFDDFYNKYDYIISLIPEKERELLKEDKNRNFNILVERGKNKLTLPENSLKYYNFSDYDFEYFYEILDLSIYNDMNISASVIFRNNLQLMEDFNIENEYELHNILRQTWEKYGKNKYKDSLDIKWSSSRNPTIVFGNGDREQQLIQLIEEQGPLTREELVNKYEELYGLNQKSLIANGLELVNQYFVNGKYDSSAESLLPEESAYLKANLNKKFYSIKELKDIIKRQFPDFNYKKLSSYNINSLGFRSFSQYIVSLNYDSAYSYFKEFLQGEGPFERCTLPYQTYHDVFFELCNSGELLEINKGRFYSPKYLDRNGVTKEIISSLINNIKKYVPENEYFSVGSLEYSMKDTISEISEIPEIPEIKEIKEKLNLNNNFFINSLLKLYEDEFSPILFKDEAVFIRKPAVADIRDFLKRLSTMKYPSVASILIKLSNNYGISIESENLKKILRAKEFYITGQNSYIFPGEKEYLEELTR